MQSPWSHPAPISGVTDNNLPRRWRPSFHWGKQGRDARLSFEMPPKNPLSWEVPQGAETSSGVWRRWVPSLRALPAKPHEHWGRSTPESNEPFSPSSGVAAWSPPSPRCPLATPTSSRLLSSWRLPAKIAAGGAGRGKGRSSGAGAGSGGRLARAAQTGSDASWPEGEGHAGVAGVTVVLVRVKLTSLTPNKFFIEMRLDRTHIFTSDPGIFDAAHASISLWKTLALLLRKNHLVLQREPRKDSDALRCHMNRLENRN